MRNLPVTGHENGNSEEVMHEAINAGPPTKTQRARELLIVVHPQNQ
jgi:hypothetical protein